MPWTLGDADQFAQSSRKITDSLGIEWVYMAWIAPGFMDGSGMLNDITGFATWWASEVADLDAHGKTTYFREANKVLAPLVAAAPVVEVLDTV